MPTTAGLLSFVFVDETGITASTPYYLSADTGQTGAQRITEAQALGTLINALTDAQIISVRYGDYVPNPGGWNSAPLAGSQVSHCAIGQFRNETNTCLFGLTIPSIKASKLSRGQLVITDTDVAAWIDHIIANSGPYRYTTTGGLHLNGWSNSFCRLRKHTNARSRFA